VGKIQLNHMHMQEHLGSETEQTVKETQSLWVLISEYDFELIFHHRHHHHHLHHLWQMLLHKK
jgi:hypothetical protein